MDLNRAAFLDAIGHEDFFVRSCMLHAFAEDRDPDPEVTLRAIASIDRFGWKEAFEWPRQVTDLALDDSSCQWLAEQVERTDEGAPDDRTKLHLLGWFSKQGPLDAIPVYLDRLASLPVAARESEIFPMHRGTTWLEKARTRLDLAGKSARECEDMLDASLAQCVAVEEEEEAFPHAEVARLQLVAERLRDTGAELDLKIMRWLAFDFEDDSAIQHWQSGAAVILAGLFRKTTTAQRLIEMLDYDWDWWNEEILRALKAMGNRETLALILAAYPLQTWHVRLFLSGVMQKVRIPELEFSVRDLLDDEVEDDLRVELASALVRYASPSAREAALAVFEEEPDDPERLAIVEYLYVVHRIQGHDLPEMQDWRQRLEAMRMKLSMDTKWDMPALEPIQRLTPKVGRNDPCPCGSGKKFKKCCLSSSN